MQGEINHVLLKIAASANQSIDAQFLAYTTGPEVSRLSGDTSEDIGKMFFSGCRSQPRPIRVDPYFMAFTTGPDTARMSVARSQDIRKLFLSAFRTGGYGNFTTKEKRWNTASSEEG
ncbi:hypothetical protein Droror1_Dr00014337 [Drosera rotundifolia]